ncbi:MAG: GGDEF domain-containing protein [Vallitaleaceae bacterium]|nr:GGDEF domain-containing protein [Vallitaleaceae bacterium]
MSALSKTKLQDETREIRHVIDKIEKLILKKDCDAALDMNVIAYERALAIDDTSLVCEILFHFGTIENLKGHIQQAMSFFVKSHNMSRDSQNFKYMILTLNRIAAVYSLYGKTRRALDAYIEVLAIINEHPEASFKRSVIYNNIGLIFFELEAYEDAEKYYMDGLEAALNSPKNSLQDELVIPILFSNLSELYLKKSDYALAEVNLEQSRKASEVLDDQVGIAFCLYLEASLINERDHDWERSEVLFEQAIKLISSNGADFETADLMIKYGKQAYYAQSYDKALKLLETALEKATEHNYLQMMPVICKTLEDLYLRENNYEKAHAMVRQQLTIKDTFSEQWESTLVKSFTQNVRDLEENRQLEELKRSIRTMKMLAEVGQSITASIDIKEIFNIVSTTITKILNLSSFALGLLNNEKTHLLQTIYDEGNYKEVTHPIDYDNSFMIWCVRNKKEIIIYSSEDILNYSEVMNEKLIQRLEKSELKSLLFCPMYIDETIIGGVTVQSKTPYNFSYVDLEVLRLLTSYIGIAINNIHKSQKLIESNKKLAVASRIDDLTSLLNRRALGDYIAHDFANLDRSMLPLAMVMLDLDYFKQYNDLYGHSQGDHCLTLVANQITETLMGLNHLHFAFRFGGDEFLIIVHNCDAIGCQEMLNSLFNKIGDLKIEHLKSKISNQVTITAGASIVNRRFTNYTEVFSNADEALYLAKNGGRNRYEILVLKEKS